MTKWRMKVTIFLSFNNGVIQSLDSSKIHWPYQGLIMKFHLIRILAANPRLVLPEEGKKAQQIHPTHCWRCFKWAYCHEDDCLIQSVRKLLWGKRHASQWQMRNAALVMMKLMVWFDVMDHDGDHQPQWWSSKQACGDVVHCWFIHLYPIWSTEVSSLAI